MCKCSWSWIARVWSLTKLIESPRTPWDCSRTTGGPSADSCQTDTSPLDETAASRRPSRVKAIATGAKADASVGGGRGCSVWTSSRQSAGPWHAYASTWVTSEYANVCCQTTPRAMTLVKPSTEVLATVPSTLTVTKLPSG